MKLLCKIFEEGTEVLKVQLPSPFLPVTFEFGEVVIGKSKVYWEKNHIFADIELEDPRFKTLEDNNVTFDLGVSAIVHYKTFNGVTMADGFSTTTANKQVVKSIKFLNVTILYKDKDESTGK